MKKSVKKVTIKKAQNGTKASKDSTAYFKAEQNENYKAAAMNMNRPAESNKAFARASKAGKDIDRQRRKGKPGYDQHGYPTKKK